MAKLSKIAQAKRKPKFAEDRAKRMYDRWHVKRPPVPVV